MPVPMVIRGLYFDMCDILEGRITSETEKIYAYLNSVDLHLLATYEWKVIRHGLAAATGLRVSDAVWEDAISSYLGAFSTE